MPVSNKSIMAYTIRNAQCWINAIFNTKRKTMHLTQIRGGITNWFNCNKITGPLNHKSRSFKHSIPRTEGSKEFQSFPASSVRSSPRLDYIVLIEIKAHPSRPMAHATGEQDDDVFWRRPLFIIILRRRPRHMQTPPCMRYHSGVSAYNRAYI